MENTAYHQSNGHPFHPRARRSSAVDYGRAGGRVSLHSTKDTYREQVAVYWVFSLLINQINSLYFLLLPKLILIDKWIKEFSIKKQ